MLILRAHKRTKILSQHHTHMYMYVNFACPDLLFSQFYYINKTDLKGKYSLLTARAMYFYEVMFFNEEQTI